MYIHMLAPLQNQCFDIAVKGYKTESVHQSAFYLLRKPADRLGVVSPCERSEN